jgi:transposase-like protein
MSQNVTLSTMISPARSLALEALVGGGSITRAAKEAGAARETVSRWVHHYPVFEVDVAKQTHRTDSK